MNHVWVDCRLRASGPVVPSQSAAGDGVVARTRPAALVHLERSLPRAAPRAPLAAPPEHGLRSHAG